MADLEGLNMDQLRARLDAGTNARREALHHAGAAYADVSAAAERQRLRMTVERQMRGTERIQEVTRQTLRKRERIDRDELYADIGSTAVQQKSLDNKELAEERVVISSCADRLCQKEFTWCLLYFHPRATGSD